MKPLTITQFQNVFNGRGGKGSGNRFSGRRNDRLKFSRSQ